MMCIMELSNLTFIFYLNGFHCLYIACVTILFMMIKFRSFQATDISKVDEAMDVAASFAALKLN